jgi:uncharacterized protein YgiM (DUF1202 family)
VGGIKDINKFKKHKSKVMKNLITILFAAITASAFSQTYYSGYTMPQSYSYTSVSKNCGSCGGAVSSNSCVGMRCPHCGVRWGYENTTTTTSHSTRTIPSSGYATTSRSANLREGASTNYDIICTMPANSSVEIIGKNGNWVKVSYDDYSGYYGRTTRIGWVSASLLEF